jgi:GNAT superfamily N-acetyltransferase
MRVGPPNSEQERADALGCLLRVDADAGSSDRLRDGLALAQAGEIDLSGLVAIWQDRRAVCAALFCLSPDGSAFVWPPEIRAGGRHEDAVAVLAEVVARTEAIGCPFAQAAVEPDRKDHGNALEAVGFQFLAELIYMQRPLCDPLSWASSIAGPVVAFTEPQAGRFAEVIERTFVGSQDCPGFTGIRSASDALHSYRSAGRFTPERWRLVERADGDVAVILVNDRPDERAREIVYFGVVPEARGQGLGRDLVTTTLHEARDQGIDSVLTAVDSSNAPAVALYESLGFSPVSRRVVYLRRGTADGRPQPSVSRTDSH